MITTLIDLWNNSLLPLPSNTTIFISAEALRGHEMSKYFYYYLIMNGGKSNNLQLNMFKTVNLSINRLCYEVTTFVGLAHEPKCVGLTVKVLLWQHSWLFWNWWIGFLLVLISVANTCSVSPINVQAEPNYFFFLTANIQSLLYF